MNAITTLCHSFKKEPRLRESTLSQPVRCWSEKDVLDRTIVDAYVLILKTRGCSWALSSGCTMCGYWNDSAMGPVSDTDLLQQFDTAMERYAGEKIVKIFTSGSFLDPGEIPQTVRNHILQKLTQTTEKISVESRPEYITQQTLTELKEFTTHTPLEVGIGLETSNDFIRTHAINKGFTFNDYKKAAQLLKKNHYLVKTYVLVKPPFLTEQEALTDTLQTIQTCTPFTDTISINPTTVQRNTLVEYLWKRYQYRPPWLWTVIEILKQGSKQSSKRLQCDVTGGGSIRGPHNCKTCDSTILKALSEFSLTQKRTVLEHLTCDCQDLWRDQLDTEALSFGSCIDFVRWQP